MDDENDEVNCKMFAHATSEFQMNKKEKIKMLRQEQILKICFLYIFDILSFFRFVIDVPERSLEKMRKEKEIRLI